MKKLICTLYLLFTMITLLHAQQASDSTQSVYLQNEELIFYDDVDEDAKPAGGMRTFYRLLVKNIVYPAEAVRSNVQGVAFIRFIVNEDGTVTFAEVVEGREVGFGIDEEVIRVIKMSTWIPGKKDGTVVKQRFIVPINFSISKGKRKGYK